MPYFKDISLKFEAHPLTGQPITVSDYASINQAFLNILSTNKTERPFENIGFGSGLQQKLFEPLTPTYIRDITESIQRDILNYEPRVLIQNISVNRVDDNSVKISIQYKIKTFDQSAVFESFLTRA